MIPRVQRPSCRENRPGVFGFRAVLISLALLAGVLFSCTPVGESPEPVTPVGPPFPALEAGGTSRSENREAAGLLSAARDSLDGGGLEGALRTASRVLDTYPRASGSSEALWIAARAQARLGNAGEAAALGVRFSGLLPPQHPLLGPALLLTAESMVARGAWGEAMSVLLGFPSGAPEELTEEVLGLGREIASSLSFRDLETLAQGAVEGSPLLGLLATEVAVARYQRGDEAAARDWASRALREDLGDREARLARGVMEERLEEILGIPVVLGVVIPRTGVSPGLLQYGEWIHEGIQVAVDEYRERLPRPVRLEVVDDRGTPLGGRTAIRSLEGLGALGALGFLNQEILRQAAATRSGGLPLFSPFNFLPPGEAPGTYSLSGPDPAGARSLAGVARELDLDTVVILRPSTMEAEMDGQAFRESFQALGGLVPREIVYDSGATFFQPQFQEMEEILPDGVFLPLPPRDISLLAPQVTFYGVDTLGVQILGTSGWTEEEVVRDVDSRHTDGVVAATTRMTQDETEAFRRFRERYEDYFQKTLRSQVPAFGYDAAALVLEALLRGPRTPGGLMAALEEIDDLPGATGVLRVREGRVTREPRLVRIQDHELIYMSRPSR